MRRAFAFSVAVVLSAAAAAAAPSCSTETTATTQTGCSLAAPALAIASPAEGACIEVGDGPDAFIPVVLSTQNILARPPGSCNGCYNCGHFILSVNGQANNAAALPMIDMVFGDKIANHYGPFELTVQLVGDDGKTWTSPAADGGADAGPGQPLTATVQIITQKSCAASSSSSSSTGSSSSSTGSSSSSGGTGGAGGMGSSSSSSGAGGAMGTGGGDAG
jgi:uncharacterized membrane protein YgcG